MLLSNTNSLMCKTDAENVYEDVCKFPKTKTFLTSVITQEIQNTEICQIA